jgi:hypothetical protein
MEDENSIHTIITEQNMITACKHEQVHKPIKYYDGYAVASNFIKYFYETWVTNPSLLSEDVIKPYSKLKYNNNQYEGDNFIGVLITFISPGFQFTDCNWEILDSGSRQIYILMTGSIKNDTTSSHFSQSFMISYTGENSKKNSRKWTLVNSLLIMK